MPTNNESVIVIAGNGVNCEVETAHACRMAGFNKVDIITIWELLAGEVSLDDYSFMVLPGGFLDGDDLGSAKAQATRILKSKVSKTGEPLINQIVNFIDNGKLILGICNGFQLMVKLGILPGFADDHLKQHVTLTFNDSGKFEDRWTSLKTNENSPCIYTRGIDTVYLPVRHGEGKFIARDDQILNKLKDNNQIVFRYINPDSNEITMEYPCNPNGSQLSIAGICDPSGRLMGLMPHPEGYLHKTNHPRWTSENLPEEGMGLVIFQNAYNYVRKNF